MPDDEALRQNVLEDLRWSPRVNATHIGVSVRDGVVELSGHVKSFVEKLEAEHVALSVKGVMGVAEEITVRLPSEKRTSDGELADRTARLLSWDARLHGDAIKVKVERGWITLTGQVRSSRERDVALSDIKRLSGVVGVTNAITLRPAPAPEDVKGQIEDALNRQAVLEGAITSEGAPTRTTATPPLSFASRSWSFSRS
jgi:osmotically-inducible protein OsmY